MGRFLQYHVRPLVTFYKNRVSEVLRVAKPLMPAGSRVLRLDKHPRVPAFSYGRYFVINTAFFYQFTHYHT